MPGRETHTQSLPLLETPDESRTRTWVQMVRTFYRISKLIVSAVAQHNLTMPQFDILATLRFSEGVTQQELAERLLVTKGNVCGVLDRLEAVKWLERRQDAKDGRANRLYLTAAGRRKIDAVLPDHDAQVIQSMRTLSSADVKSLRRLLTELERANAA
jgi:DNA-binding MarR family transcriptional regulator